MSDMPIVVGTDGSEYASAAVDLAMREAALRKSPLKIIYAFAPRYSRYDVNKDGVASPVLAECERIVEAEKARVLERHDELDVLTEVLVANPADALIEASADAELVVVGARGLGAIRRLFLGSVSHAVAARAHCPVYVVRQGAEPGAGPVVAGMSPDSGASEVLDFALSFAEAHNRPLVALQARQHAGSNVYDIETAGMQDVVAQRMAAVDKTTKERYAQAVARYPNVDASFRSVSQHAIDALLDAAEEASVIVIGRVSATKRAGDALGSVADSVLAEAPRVIVVPVTPSND